MERTAERTVKKQSEMDASCWRKGKTLDASNAEVSSVSEDGAGGGTRTHTMSPSADFESATSTNSITPAHFIEKLPKILIGENKERTHYKSYILLYLGSLEKSRFLSDFILPDLLAFESCKPRFPALSSASFHSRKPLQFRGFRPFFVFLRKLQFVRKNTFGEN